ncbi:SIS domain-containing protein [Nonomuraea pusilla]|uniref:D-sedoheptulose-7-phosphate isomerase n=1 Tax=Nonomuraea pusilla TaxID=46177 RepID=UPI00331C6BEC
MTETLYPFLREGEDDAESLIEQVRRSTAAKAMEVVELRAQVVAAEEERLRACAAAMADRFARGGRLLAFGNGGSATDAQAVAGVFCAPAGGSRPLPALSLTGDIAVITALSNDVGPDVVFSRQVAAFGRPCDIAVGLSTSGNSANLLRAFDTAAARGLLTVGLAGYDGGRMAELDSIEHLFVVPSPSVHRVQEVQTTLCHLLWELTVEALGRDLREESD